MSAKTHQTMIIGENTRIRGIIEGDDDLVVQGHVEGTVHISGALVIESDGQVFADVVARDVTVSGLLRGNVTASSHIQVTRSGRMAGDAIAPAVSIASGATFRGRIEMGDVRMLEAVPVERRALPREAPDGDRRALPREGLVGELPQSSHAPERALTGSPAAPATQPKVSVASAPPSPPPAPVAAAPTPPVRRTVPSMARPRSGRMQRRETP
jgi:cytoskeletal protein CcmA (bactofilin family)